MQRHAGLRITRGEDGFEHPAAEHGRSSELRKQSGMGVQGPPPKRGERPGLDAAHVACQNDNDDARFDQDRLDGGIQCLRRSMRHRREVMRGDSCRLSPTQRAGAALVADHDRDFSPSAPVRARVDNGLQCRAVARSENAHGDRHELERVRQRRRNRPSQLAIPSRSGFRSGRGSEATTAFSIPIVRLAVKNDFRLSLSRTPRPGCPLP
jgi:hypothetical protein